MIETVIILKPGIDNVLPLLGRGTEGEAIFFLKAEVYS
jgi:hypothetical protein